MSRRRALLLLAALLTVAPVSAQPRRTPRVGILSGGPANDPRVEELRDGLRELGYVEGRSVVFVHRWADGRRDRLRELASELVTNNVDAIVTIGPTVWAAKERTTTVPIVIAFSGDPVGTGIVADVNAIDRHAEVAGRDIVGNGDPVLRIDRIDGNCGLTLVARQLADINIWADSQSCGRSQPSRGWGWSSTCRRCRARRRRASWPAWPCSRRR